MPETLALIVPIFMDTPEDFALLEKAALSTKKYMLSGYRVERINGGIFPYSWLPFDLPYVRKY